MSVIIKVKVINFVFIVIYLIKPIYILCLGCRRWRELASTALLLNKSSLLAGFWVTLIWESTYDGFPRTSQSQWLQTVSVKSYMLNELLCGGIINNGTMQWLCCYNDITLTWSLNKLKKIIDKHIKSQPLAIKKYFELYWLMFCS